MLGGDDDAGGLDRLAVDIAKGDLALGVGQKPGGGAVALAAQLAHPPQDQVGIIERRRHQPVGLAAGIAEHDALIARPLVLVAGGVDALGDVGGLAVQQDLDLRVAPGEAGLIVADVLDGVAREAFQFVGGD